MKKIKFIDLFSGLGGFRIALEELGYVCVFSSDIDQYARNTYFENFSEIPAGDITKIDEKEIPDHDIMCAGFPCQPFSIAGKRRGFEDTRGTLFFDVARIVKEKKPKVVFLENVAGLVSHDNGNTLETIEKTLADLGYLLQWKVMNAKDYGVPQNRNRWYGIAIRNDIRNKDAFAFPETEELKYTLADIIYDADNDILGNYEISDIVKNNILKHISKFKTSPRYSEDFPLLANEIRPSRCNFRSDGISPCLTAKMGTGGSNVPVVVNQNRKLTERECLKIMGFPDTYKIRPNYSQTYKQIGNSVAVPVIRSISKRIDIFLREG